MEELGPKDKDTGGRIAPALYLVFAAGCLIVYRLLEVRAASGSYDYIMTFGSGLQTLAFALLVFRTTRGVGEGLSEKSLWAFCAAHVLRLSTTLWSNAYVPEDNTDDVFLYQGLEIAGVLLVAYKLRQLNASRTLHDIAQMERWNLLAGIAAICLVLAHLSCGIGHKLYIVNLVWMFSVWLEAFALLPQVLLLFTSSASFVEESAVHFVAVSLLASIAFAAFWSRVSSDRYEEFEREGAHGFFIGLMTACGVRVLLACVYLGLFVRSANAYKGAVTSSGRGEYSLCEQDVNWEEL
eukprot:TRINITY_DN40621_c0_g1_i1.p1 TRINITY_DN40621_c0_g1~~TRINITY_DN40621_c0_g1_i1.p1  ORF type:complete len:295 (+),score=64.65 TRINITY_DN40621_c0_g1_i1:73-957(+)